MKISNKYLWTSIFLVLEYFDSFICVKVSYFFPGNLIVYNGSIKTMRKTQISTITLTSVLNCIWNGSGNLSHVHSFLLMLECKHRLCSKLKGSILAMPTLWRFSWNFLSNKIWVNNRNPLAWIFVSKVNKQRTLFSP